MRTGSLRFLQVWLTCLPLPIYECQPARVPHPPILARDGCKDRHLKSLSPLERGGACAGRSIALGLVHTYLPAPSLLGRDLGQSMQQYLGAPYSLLM